MKNLILLSFVLAALEFASPANADDGYPEFMNPNNSVEAHLANITDRVRNCSVQPYTIRNGVKVFHPLMSHCPEVKVLEKGKAKIKVGGSIYNVYLTDSPNSDGDFYDVVIRDYISNDTYTLKNVLAFGDVLIGILSGNKARIPQSYVTWNE